MRAAIAEHPVAGVDILPLALDEGGDSMDAQRTAQKLRADGSVRAVIGPLSPAMAAATASVLGSAPPAWIVPFAVAPGEAFADPVAGQAWATGLVAAVGKAARSQGAQALILAGESAGWPVLTAAAWSEAAGMPVRVATDKEVGAAVAEVRADDAVFWLGSPAAAAEFVTALRQSQPETPFWMGPQGGDPVFAERAGTTDHVYWATWSDIDYNTWLAQHTPSTPSAFQVYLATRQAIEAIGAVSIVGQH